MVRIQWEVEVEMSWTATREGSFLWNRFYYEVNEGEGMLYFLGNRFGILKPLKGGFLYGDIDKLIKKGKLMPN